MFQFSQKVISQLSRKIQYRIWSTMFTFKCVILPLMYRHMRKIEETTRNFKSDVSAWPWNWQTPSSQFSKATTVKRTTTKSRGRVAMGFSLQWSPQSPEFVSPQSFSPLPSTLVDMSCGFILVFFSFREVVRENRISVKCLTNMCQVLSDEFHVMSAQCLNFLQ